LAEEIKESLGLEATLKKSSGGRFEVYLNEELVFSKAKLYRFPQSGEVVTIINGILES
jgi:selT/selW/selH-like putative selenoprotein